MRFAFGLAKFDKLQLQAPLRTPGHATGTGMQQSDTDEAGHWRTVYHVHVEMQPCMDYLVLCALCVSVCAGGRKFVAYRRRLERLGQEIPDGLRGGGSLRVQCLITGILRLLRLVFCTEEILLQISPACS